MEGPNILTGTVDWFNWRYQNGCIIQDDGTTIFFKLEGGRLPKLIANCKQKKIRWVKPDMYPKKMLNGKKILYVISQKSKKPFAEAWMLEEDFDSAKEEALHQQ